MRINFETQYELNTRENTKDIEKGRYLLNAFTYF